MKKSTKTLIVILAILLLIFLVYWNSKTGIEKSVIKNKIAKATWEPILGKEPAWELESKIVRGKIPFVQNKQIANKYDENKTVSSESLVVKWKSVDNPNPEDVKKLDEIYFDFIEETSDARYFKADFTELLKKKVGDEVILVIDGEEFNGQITKAEITPPLQSEIAQGLDYPDFNFYIQPIGENLNEVGDIIDISGFIDLDGNYKFSGDIKYTRNNEGIAYEFKVNNDIGVILPSDDFQNSLNITAD